MRVVVADNAGSLAGSRVRKRYRTPAPARQGPVSTVAMQLKKIRLAGFKSFVDPTTVPLAGRRVGVVGPNGCGKSNLIDAVRWVMGESSAKHLRGESSTDVIFNGSSDRSAVGQASIELVFDNSDGTLGGQYGSYNEIAVRRQVNREGQSFYSLNGTRCRRRDIRDVFLGTGVQPRGYTIIEQGMISRVIESRPEELRTYLEEAAGISLYKERRRETERRIRDARENLDRLNDLREEVSSQLARSRRQAEVAERYRELKEQERRQRAERTVLRLMDLDARREQAESRLRELENTREAAVADQRRAEREMESLREAAAERHASLNTIQGQYYDVGARVAALEERIQSERERRETRTREYAELQSSLEEIRETRKADEARCAELEEQIETLEPMLESAETREASAQEEQQAAQAQWDGWREQREAARRQRDETARRIELERMREQQAARRVKELDERIATLDRQAEEDAGADAGARIEAAAEEVEALAAEIDARTEARETATEQVAEARRGRDECASELEQAREALSGVRARQTSLQTLQESALGREEADATLADWLSAHGFADASRLAEGLDVDDGWESAVETALGGALQAIRVDRIPNTLSGTPPGSAVMLVDDAHPASAGPRMKDALAHRVRGSASAADLLGGVRCIEDVDAAFARRHELAPGESWITPSGVWVGCTWVHWPTDRTGGSDVDGAGSVLRRERALEALAAEIEAAEARVATLEAQLASAREALAQAEAARDEAAAALEPLNRRHADAEARLRHAREQQASDQRRAEARQRERDDAVKQREQARSEQQEAADAVEVLLEESEAAQTQWAEVDGQEPGYRDALERAAETLREAREARHQTSGRLERARTEHAAVREQLRRGDAQLQRMTQRHDELQQALAESGDPAHNLQQERDELLEERSRVEAQLTEVRQAADRIDQQLREQDAIRIEAGQRAEAVREDIDALRLELGEARVLREREAADLVELDANEADVRERLPEGATTEAWEQAVAATEAALSRLGAVNLAAIDECQQLEERQSYLEAQHADLTEGLETLENAIRRIDRETRARFRDTYEKVNQGLSTFFPRLFGGGRAYLEMTDDDLLQTGVTVMAQPPGKRISSIHQLSGGEKALTAVALVFAIFHLNPAPFCLLDEVDAPLDEANVGRFCDLLEEMSEKVQFLIITHNKTTMERVSHLLGVTMNEPGVSRLVAVDVDEAADLAEVG